LGDAARSTYNLFGTYRTLIGTLKRRLANAEALHIRIQHVLKELLQKYDTLLILFFG
jgi:hypothetical protein